MRIGFYAPMKAPDHPVASGDRRMARQFMDLLAGLGHEVVLASRLRSWDGTGNPARQARLAGLGRGLARRLLSTHPDYQLWFTYHLYHKAPDHLGPAVARALGIPYVVAEASVAGKRAHGPWAMGHAAVLDALAQADGVLAMTRVDRAGLAAVVPDDRLVLFSPFIDARPFAGAHVQRGEIAAAYGLDMGQPWLLAVAMMRADAKLRSYRLLAASLAELGCQPWQLLIVGDGPARSVVEAAFAAQAGRVRFAGELPPCRLPGLYAAADLYVWPACDEAYGLGILEAQAAGLAVVAGAEYGVPDIVQDRRTGLLVAARAPAAFARAIGDLLGTPERRRAMGAQARKRVLAEHDMVPAGHRLTAILAAILAEVPTCGSA